jgi:hypothetical protein
VAPQVKNTRHSSNLWFFAVSLYLLFGLWGVAVAIHPDSTVLAVLFSLAISWTIAYWCVLDSRDRGHPIVFSLQWLLFLTWPVAAPYYLTWSRGPRGLLVAAVCAFALLAIYVACFALASMALT